MTFIFAVFGHIPESIRELAANRFGDKVIISSPDYLLAGGGLKETFAYRRNSESDIAVCGVPLQKIKDKYILVRNENLDEVAQNPSKASSFEGHFIFCTRGNNTLTVANDILGFREFYEYAGDGYSIISTEARFIADIVGGFKLNQNWLATGFLLKVQLDKESYAHGITRYCGAEMLQLKLTEKGLIRERSKLQAPSEYPKTEEEIKNEIIQLSFPEIDDFQSAISMSGGLDSRFLLSLMKPAKSDLKAVSIGFADHPDNITAAKICKLVGIEHSILDSDDLESYPFTFDDIINYVEGNKSNSVASEYLFMRLSDNIYKSGLIQIDAGWAEIGRHSDFSAIYYSSKYGLGKIDKFRLYELLKSPRPRFFDKALKQKIKSISLEKADEIINLYALNQVQNLEKRLDSFAIDYKIGNNISGKQSRADNSSISLSPFNQPIMNRALVELDFNRKSNGKFYKETIKQTYPQLAEINLIKGSHVIPFNFGTLTSRLYIKLTKSKYRRDYAVEMFRLFGSEIRDYLNSSETLSSGYYDKDIVQNIVNNANLANPKSCNDLDSLLTFEIFRRSIESPKKS
ncbi:MAG: asparagine synthase-related protein [Candidatus Kapabacteria bacterium]|nr:asparagine synthase-related protein [Candidatus Kapabacteria bacterium]